MHAIIRNGLEFFNQTNIQLSIPQHGSISIHENKKQDSFCTVDHIGRADIENIPLFKTLTMFTLFDFFIDLQSPSTSGQSFKKKYENLPSSNDREIILKETFRLAKIIRNSLVHNLSNSTLSDENLSISYTFQSTPFQLNISKKGLILFNSIIYLFLSEKYGSGEYFLGCIRSMYHNMKNEISQFQDEFDSELGQLINDFKLNYILRDTLLNPSYTINNGLLTFSNIANVPNLGNLDLFIKLDDHIHLLPSEALDKNNTITISEIREKWSYTFTSPSHDNVNFSTEN